MINKVSKTWSVYGKSLNNAYGQSVKGELKTSCDISIVIYVKNKNEADVRFVDTTHVGFTKNLTIVSGDYITDGVELFLVEYTIPTTRQHQLFLREQV